MAKRLGALDKEFRNSYYQLLDLIDEGDKGALANEQRDLDNHDDVIDDANMHIKQLIISSSSN